VRTLCKTGKTEKGKQRTENGTTRKRKDTKPKAGG